jgi:hypothetical protein
MSTTLLKAIHKAASVGWVYDSIQFLAGASITRSRLRHYLEDCHGRVLDIGGGTGSLNALLPPGCRYTCLENAQASEVRGEGAERTAVSRCYPDAT